MGIHNMINPRHACAVRITVVVCLSVCVLRDISLHNSPIALQTIPHIQRRIKVEKYAGFSLKLLRSRVMVICVIEKCNYARHLFLATIVMTLRFCTCTKDHASTSFIHYKALLMNQSR